MENTETFGQTRDRLLKFVKITFRVSILALKKRFWRFLQNWLVTFAPALFTEIYTEKYLRRQQQLHTTGHFISFFGLWRTETDISSENVTSIFFRTLIVSLYIVYVRK